MSDAQKTEEALARCLPRLVRLRADLFEAIRKYLEEDGHCKSYEGRMEIVMPDYFSDEWGVNLHCYVIGQSRHYSWTGATPEEAVKAAETEIRSWLENDIY